MSKKSRRKEDPDAWKERALQTQAVVVRACLTDVPRSVEEIRDAINTLGHDFADAHVLAGLERLAEDGEAKQALSGRWLIS